MYLCCICICTAFVFVFKSCRDYLLLSQKGRWTSRSQCYVFCILSWGWTDLPSSSSNTFFSVAFSSSSANNTNGDSSQSNCKARMFDTNRRQLKMYFVTYVLMYLYTDRSWKCTSVENKITIFNADRAVLARSGRQLHNR